MKQKKWMTIMAMVLCLVLTACGGQGGGETTAPETSAPETTTPETAVANEIPVLMWPGRFTGLTQLEAVNDYRGGYFYQELTEDGLTVITNCAFANDQGEDEEFSAYLRRIAQDLSSTEVQDLDWQAHVDHSQRMTYPVHILTWTTGGNEDTRGWDAFFFQTDTHTYVFAFNTAIDFREEMLPTWEAVFDTLTLG